MTTIDLEKWPTASIQTYTGIEFFPLNATPETIDQIDIAHALSNTCRYTGHSAFHFSVAQHSVLLCDYIQLIELSEDDQRWGLMHDASEAYLPDIAKPIKHLIAGFMDIEDNLLHVIAKRFKLPWPKSPIISRLDRLLFWREREVLLGEPTWIRRDPSFEDTPKMMREHIPIERWTPERARQEWWMRFCNLFPNEEKRGMRR
jgi:hypothetical protein